MSQDYDSQPALNSVLQELELVRLKIKSTRVKAITWIALCALYTIIAFIIVLAVIWAYLPGIAALIYGVYLYSSTTASFSQYKNDFKRRVIGTALKSINESLAIEPNSGMSRSEFVSSQLFSQNPDRYSSEDQVSGKADKTSFYFSEVHAEYKTVSTDSKGRRQESWHEILKGIIFVADFNKDFKGFTIVRPKSIGNQITAWISKAMPGIFSSGNTLVTLENVAFNTLFTTHSTDQIEARYILTPALMDKLCSLNDKCRYTISVSFVKSTLYIAFPLDHNYFEPPVYKSLLLPSCIEEDLSVIRFMHEIITDLDLNTRIWSKS